MIKQFNNHKAKLYRDKEAFIESILKPWVKIRRVIGPIWPANFLAGPQIYTNLTNFEATVISL